MTQTIKQKGQALLAEIRDEASKLIGFNGPTYQHLTRWADCVEALCRAIEQHEAFRQEVSDAVVTTYNNGCSQRPYVSPRDYMDGLRRFIIDPPVDPLVEAMHDCGVDRFESWADQLRAAIEKRGGKITWGEGW